MAAAVLTRMLFILVVYCQKMMNFKIGKNVKENASRPMNVVGSIGIHQRPLKKLGVGLRYGKGEEQESKQVLYLVQNVVQTGYTQEKKYHIEKLREKKSICTLKMETI